MGQHRWIGRASAILAYLKPVSAQQRPNNVHDLHCSHLQHTAHLVAPDSRSSSHMTQSSAVLQMEMDDPDALKYEDLSAVAHLAASDRYRNIMQVFHSW